MFLSEDTKDKGHTAVLKPASHLLCLALLLLQTAIGVFHLTITHINSKGQMSLRHLPPPSHSSAHHCSLAYNSVILVGP